MHTIFTIDSGEAGMVTCEVSDNDGKVSRKKIKLEDFYGIILKAIMLCPDRNGHIISTRPECLPDPGRPEGL